MVRAFAHPGRSPPPHVSVLHRDGKGQEQVFQERRLEKNCCLRAATGRQSTPLLYFILSYHYFSITRAGVWYPSRTLPAKMAPGNSTIIRELKEVVRRAYYGPDRDELTVNYTRREAEESLGLEAGFLRREDWKAKSKQIITDALVYHSAVSDEASYANNLLVRMRSSLVTWNLHHLRALVL